MSCIFPLPKIFYPLLCAVMQETEKECRYWASVRTDDGTIPPMEGKVTSPSSLSTIQFCRCPALLQALCGVGRLYNPTPVTV